MLKIAHAITRASGSHHAVSETPPLVCHVAAGSGWISVATPARICKSIICACYSSRVLVLVQARINHCIAGPTVSACARAPRVCATDAGLVAERAGRGRRGVCIAAPCAAQGAASTASWSDAPPLLRLRCQCIVDLSATSWIIKFGDANVLRVQMMNAELDRVLAATAFSTVPSMWQTASYLALEPAALCVVGMFARLNNSSPDWCAPRCSCCVLRRASCNACSCAGLAAPGCPSQGWGNQDMISAWAAEPHCAVAAQVGRCCSQCADVQRVNPLRIAA